MNFSSIGLIGQSLRSLSKTNKLNPYCFTYSRVVQVLPINVDPIPKSIILDFGLLTLHDVSTFTLIPIMKHTCNS